MVFDKATPRNPGIAVHRPASALKVFAIVAIVLNCVLSIGIQFRPRPSEFQLQGLPDDHPVRRGADAAPFLDLVFGLAFAFCTTGIFYPLIIMGATRMRQQRSYGFSLFVCLLAMIPCSLATVVGAPLGLWGLIALMRPGVRESFAPS